MSRRPPIPSLIRDLYKSHTPSAILPLLTTLTTHAPSLVRTSHPVLSAAFRRLPTSTTATFLTSLAHSPTPPLPSFYSGLLLLYGKASLPSHALQTFSLLPLLGCRHSPSLLLALLRALSACGESALSFDALVRHPPDAVPSVACFNVVIDSLFKAGNLDGGLECFCLMMKKYGFVPTLVTYNIVLNGFYANLKFEDAQRVWERMSERSLLSFNARMRGLVRMGRVEDAVGVFKEIRKAGFEPDGFSYTALVVGWCEVGEVGKAKKVFEEMRRKGWKPNWSAFEAMVPALCHGGEVERAWELCEESMRMGFRIRVEATQAVVDKLAKSGREKEARELVELGWVKCYNEENLGMPVVDSNH